MLLRIVKIFFLFFFVLFVTYEAKANVSASDIINLNNEFKKFIERCKEIGQQHSMNLALYALETGRYEIYFYLSERDGFVIRYKSSLQEENVHFTTIFHTAIRKGDAELLNILMNKCTEIDFTSVDYDINKLEDSRGINSKTCCDCATNIIGLALLPNYINYNVLKTILDHGADPNGTWRYRYHVKVDFRWHQYKDATTTYQAFMLDRLDIVELLLQYNAKLDDKILSGYIENQNIDGVRLVITYGAKVFWSHIELALKYNTNPEGEKIALLLFEIYDQEKPIAK